MYNWSRGTPVATRMARQTSGRFYWGDLMDTDFIWYVVKLGGFFAALIVLLSLIPGCWWCRMGSHRWDSPGGDCEDCGAHDDFFGR